jgi:hypothetical protein
MPNNKIMKTKLILKPLLILAVIIFISNCSKKEVSQVNKNSADTIKSVQSIPVMDSVSKENLSANTKDYISSHYPGYIINDVVKDPLCKGGDAVDVSIIKNGQPRLSLIFKPDGTFVQKEEDVAYKTAPEKIKNTIKTQYGSFTASDQMEQLTMADNSTQYLIDLSMGSILKEVILTLDGNVICEN